MSDYSNKLQLPNRPSDDVQRQRRRYKINIARWIRVEITSILIFVIPRQLGSSSSKYSQKRQTHSPQTDYPRGGRCGLVKIN
jgi:hypothetical protein